MKCPKCENEEFAYVEAKKPKIKLSWKILCLLAIFMPLSIAISYNIPIITTICSIISTFAIFTYIGMLIYQKFNRSQTHTKAICKNCNHVEWIK